MWSIWKVKKFNNLYVFTSQTKNINHLDVLNYYNERERGWPTRASLASTHFHQSIE